MFTDEDLPVHPFTHLQAIGLTRLGLPIWPVAGGAPDDDPEGDDGDDPEDGPDGDDNGSDPPTGDDDTGKDKDSKYTAPTEAEWKRTQAALARSNKQASARRKELEELKKSGETPSEKTIREAKEEGVSEATGVLKPALIRSEARSALQAAGAKLDKPEKLQKLFRLINVDEVEVDEDGTVSGIEDQIASIKEDFPELFGRVTVGNIDGAGGRRQVDGDKKKSSADKLAAGLLGGGK